MVDDKDKISGSRLALRGHVFTATKDKPVRATEIWSAADADLFVTFKLDGTALEIGSASKTNNVSASLASRCSETVRRLP